MRKLIIVAGNQIIGNADITVEENGNTTHYNLPVGIELTVSDAVADAASKQYICQVGYFVADEEMCASIPTSGIADGSYCFVLQTGAIHFLSNGAWR